MFSRRDPRAFIRILLILVATGGATNASALLLQPTAMNGNQVYQALSSAPNEIGFALAFHDMTSASFDVVFESNDDPFSPVALMGLIENLTVVPWAGLTMTLGGGATLTEIGDAMPSAIVNAFARGTAAEITFDPAFTPSANGILGSTDRWLINTHGARRFSITFASPVPPMGARVPEPATLALLLIAFVSMRRRSRPVFSGADQ